MHRRLKLLLGLLLAALLIAVWHQTGWRGLPGVRAGPTGRRATPLVRPNVVLISLDTTRPDHLGCYGYPKPTSPYFDELARRSTLFTNCRAQAPWTFPSHMSLFTSMLPSENGVDALFKVLPPGIPTLAQALQAGGYHTAAFVNNGEMEGRSGFSRGFDLWKEFDAIQPEGNCDNITAQATRWLARNPPTPFFLFLHYYSAHDPYLFCPEPYHSGLGGAEWGPAGADQAWDARLPGRPVDAALLQRMIGAYDGCLAWEDAAVGWLLRALPPDTVVVVFSDHGEAFKEHGWLRHGNTLYEEEVRTALVIHVPGEKAARVDEPVALMDVAPTILGLCGIQPPPSFEGTDLRTYGSDGPRHPARIIPSETKSYIGGQIAKGIVVYPWKLIVHIPQATWELYKLPDEKTECRDSHRDVFDALAAQVRPWVERESFWLLTTHGAGVMDVRIDAQGAGRLGVGMVLGAEQVDGSFQNSPDLRSGYWKSTPGDEVRRYYVEMSPSDAALQVDFRYNGEARPDMVFIGPGASSPSALPFTLTPPAKGLDPLAGPPKPRRPGLYIIRYRGGRATTGPSNVEAVSQKTLDRLRTLGYIN